MPRLSTPTVIAQLASKLRPRIGLRAHYRHNFPSAFALLQNLRSLASGAGRVKAKHRTSLFARGKVGGEAPVGVNLSGSYSTALVIFLRCELLSLPKRARYRSSRPRAGVCLGFVGGWVSPELGKACRVTLLLCAPAPQGCVASVTDPLPDSAPRNAPRHRPCNQR